MIPKVSNPIKPSDFRLISLCNVIYKLTFKVLANRSKKILPKIISPSQRAFIPGRLITNNVIIAYVALHTITTKKKGIRVSMALKLDMSKAYDRVEWQFLETMMKKLGFEAQWIAIMMRCISTVSYVVLINGQEGHCFRPNRGLR